MTDLILTITVDLTGEGKGVFILEKNYKEILHSLTLDIKISENDNLILEKRTEALAEKWYNLKNKTQAAWNEIEKEFASYKKQTDENNEYIKTCVNTIKLIETLAEIRGWE